MSTVFNHCRAKVLNRGKPPVSFLEELVSWGAGAPEEIFLRNDRHDVYSSVRDELGPWTDTLDRKATMLEVLRVLAGFESSWDWNAGRDTTNPSSNQPCTEEAGIFQCSGNSMDIDPSLRHLLQTVAARSDCDTFRAVMKANHDFAFEYTARLLRFTVNHHGPIKGKHVNPWLSRDAAGEFRQMLAS
ncbi:hypothetical protein SAMN02745157_0104 [Kaistia soli DSM 19436]|uniref:Uncharacterized protein n=1 Tax=Kaistia soli DSM 19436 TaxID=1122133 RepID=A0A1M5PA52_9HYPH|nr:hypothetical protein [Kaistia soli]SHG98648.1 hypothetical protein SAMN02745157_0104 [Kaistia soli DSM 19436]